MYISKKFIKDEIKRLRHQEKLHGKWASQGIGENPDYTLPAGFDHEHAFSLIGGYDSIIEYLERTFGVKE